MKYIVLIIGLLVVGCGEVENGAYKHRPKQTDTNESTPATNTNKANGTAENSVEAPTLEEWVIGTYEVDAIKMVLLENGACESYVFGKKVDDAKWRTVDWEIHIINEGGISIARINLNGSLTEIAKIPKGGKRISTPKEFQLTLKKIKAKPAKELTPEEKKVVGAYEIKKGEDTAKLVLLENGMLEIYDNGEKIIGLKWELVGKEVHVDLETRIRVYKIEPNGDLTEIAKIRNEKRFEVSKEYQFTFKKIK